jgi:AcrR family transcriptional regulator
MAAKRSRRGPSRGATASRAEKSEARRQAIVAAALDEFSARGFAAARLDDVARRAGVAKGTIYLHFRDKEALFIELVRSVIGPLVSSMEAALARDIPLRAVAETVVELFLREVYGTRRKDVIRLILTEGQRFPKITEFYYREVISRILRAARVMLQRAAARGEIGAEQLARFPLLLPAPLILAILWNSLFERFEPLDVRAMLRMHLDLLLGERRAP